MKVTDRQRLLIVEISRTIGHWSTSNDIDSPSHWNLIEEDVRMMDIPDSDAIKLEDAIGNILEIVRRNKE